MQLVWGARSSRPPFPASRRQLSRLSIPHQWVLAGGWLARRRSGRPRRSRNQIHLNRSGSGAPGQGAAAKQKPPNTHRSEETYGWGPVWRRGRDRLGRKAPKIVERTSHRRAGSGEAGRGVERVHRHGRVFSSIQEPTLLEQCPHLRATHVPHQRGQTGARAQ